MNERSKNIPKLFETENVPLNDKVIHQRYRIEELNFYWLIAEVNRNRNLAFGYANLNNDDFAEWGYISIDELLENGAELDDSWKSCNYSNAMKRMLEEKRNKN